LPNGFTISSGKTKDSYQDFILDGLNLKLPQPVLQKINGGLRGWCAQAWDRFLRCESHVGDLEMARFVKLIKNVKGATAIEYGLIAALIAVAAIGAMQGIGNKLNTTFNNVSNNLN
jgi:pilus assembly protein Flp/PilA